MHKLINNCLLIKTAKCLMAVLLAGIVFSAPVSANETAASEDALLAYSNKNNNKNSNNNSRNSSNYQPVDSWKPYYTWIGNVQDQNARMFNQMTVGLGFLYFANNRGDLAANPAPANSLNVNTAIPVKGKIGYNRTPVFNYSVGWRIFNWFKLALGLEHQNGVSVQTDAVQGVAVGARVSAATEPVTQLRANLGLNAMFVKAMFELPWAMIWKSWMYTPYFNVGVGPCWQSWTDVRVFQQYYRSQIESTFVNTLNQKYPASCFWQLDAGFRTKAANPNFMMSFVFGCRFSSWGQSRNIGMQGQQGSWPFSLAEPFRVKMLYSFVPYIGAQWNF